MDVGSRNELVISLKTVTCKSKNEMHPRPENLYSAIFVSKRDNCSLFCKMVETVTCHR